MRLHSTLGNSSANRVRTKESDKTLVSGQILYQYMIIVSVTSLHYSSFKTWEVAIPSKGQL